MRIQSSGPKEAKVVIVIDNATPAEANHAKALMCGTGQTLVRMLANVGINTNNCRIMHVIPDGIAHDKISVKYHSQRTGPTQLLLNEYARIREELGKLNPNVILCCGAFAARAVTGNNFLNIKKSRGTIFSTKFGKMVATYNPGFINLWYKEKPIMQIDLHKLAREQLSPFIKREPMEHIIDPSYDIVVQFLNEEPELCAFDIETIGKDTQAQVRCLGFSADGKSAICIPFIRISTKNHDPNKLRINPINLTETVDCNAWTEQQELEIVRLLCKFFANPKIKFVAQNFSFDGPLLEQNFGIRIANFYLDTMHAHHTAYMEFPMSLDFLTSVYTDIGHYSDHDTKNDHSEWTYNCTDCIATWRSIEPILSDLRELDMEEFYFRHVHPLACSLTRAGQRGILINHRERDKLGEPLEAEINSIREKYLKRFQKKILKNKKKKVKGKEINEIIEANKYTAKLLGSPLQVKQIISEELKHAIPLLNRAESTNERAIQGMVGKYPDEEFYSDLLLYREKQKLYGTYVTSALDSDHRLRTSYNTSGTNTGRISSSKTIWKTGGNLQNIPKSPFRRLFIPSPGFSIISADLKQAEAMCVAWLTKDLELMERFIHDPDFDIHTFAASRIYGCSEKDVTDKQRNKGGKPANHSGNYGVKHKTFAHIAKIPAEDAAKILKKHQGTIFMKNWWQSVRDRLHSTRTLVSPFGRKKIFYGRFDDVTYRAGYSYEAQSCIGDIVNRSVYITDHCFNPDRARLLLQVHDELDVEFDPQYQEETVEIIKNAMIQDIIVHKDLPPMRIPVEITVGPNWWDQELVGVYK